MTAMLKIAARMEFLCLVQICLCLKPSVLSVQMADAVVSLVLFVHLIQLFFFLFVCFCFQSIKASENFRATRHQDKFIQTSSVDSDC